MADDKPTVFGPKATEQIAKTVREVARREMNPRGHRGRWQWHGGGDSIQFAWATIAESGADDQYQTVTLYDSASPKAMLDGTCGDVPFDDMDFDLCGARSGTETVLVPAGYKGGKVGLIKLPKCDGDSEFDGWNGWTVIVGARMRCAIEIPTKWECCPFTQEIQATEFKNFWFFGEMLDPRTDPCPTE